MKILKIIEQILMALILIFLIILIKSYNVDVYAGGCNMVLEKGIEESTKYYCMDVGDCLPSGSATCDEEWEFSSGDTYQPNRNLAAIFKAGFDDEDIAGYVNRGNISASCQRAVWKWLNINENLNDPYKSYGYFDNGDDLSKLSKGEKNEPFIPYYENAHVEMNSTEVKMTSNKSSVSFKQISGEICWVEAQLKNKSTGEVITKDNYVQFYKNSDCTGKINYNEMKKGEIYYFKNPQEYLITNLTFTAEVPNNGGYKIIVHILDTGYNYEQRIMYPELVSNNSKEKAECSVSVRNPYGNLKIKKRGYYINDNGEQNPVLEDVKFKIGYPTDDRGNYKWIKSDGTDAQNFDGAYEFKTNQYGEINVSNLWVENRKYIVVETASINNYNDPIAKLSRVKDGEIVSEGNSIKIGEKEYPCVNNIDLIANQTVIVNLLNDKTSGKLTIHKSDYNDKSVSLEGAQFIIKLENGQNTDAFNGSWIKKEINKNDKASDYFTNNDKNNAYKFETDEDGDIEILGLMTGTYHIYEVTAPRGYNITKQDKYNSQNQWVDCGSVTISTENNSVTYNVENKKIVTDIKGFVWVDGIDGKEQENNNIYNREEDSIKNMTVRLYYHNNDGNEILFAEDKTDYLGQYKFEKKMKSFTDRNIYYWELANCYVKFIYNNKEYVCVNPFVGNNLAVNSKAQEYQMDINELDDNKLTGDDGKYPGIAVTNINGLGLSEYYDNSDYSVKYINLGLLKKYTPQFTVNESLYSVKIKLNGYSYTYKYDNNDSKIITDYVPKVFQQVSGKEFSAAVYPSDVAYNTINDNSLKVYVVYKIDITNNEEMQKDNIYSERGLYINSLKNIFDSDRYNVCNTGIDDDENNEKFALWDAHSKKGEKGNATYDIKRDDNLKSGIESNKTKSTYIQFEMVNDAVNKIIEGNLTEGDIENSPTGIKVDAYHEYMRKDNVWDSANSKKYYENAKNQSNNNDEFIHKSVNMVQNSAELYIRFTLGNPRTISGTVFEDTDKNSDDREALGNGILDTDEKTRAQGVKVELLNKDKNTVSLYQVQDKAVYYSEDKELPKAETSTNEKGEYSFEGVVPGYYYIRFTYGDGSQKLVSADIDKAISSQDYKSTIINTEKTSLIKEAMEANSDNIAKAQKVLVNAIKGEESDEETIIEAKKLLEWYKYIDIDGNYSIAVDDLAQREALSEFTYKEDKVYNKDGNEVTFKDANINAYSPMLGISIENDKKTSTIKSDYNQENSSKYSGFNFGIIKVPEIVIIPDKKITDLKIINQIGTTIVSADFSEARSSSYFTALDDITNGTKYGRVEMESSQIYGSAVETTYEIELKNESQEDYIENNSENIGNYYKYGSKDNVSLKNTNILEVEDKIDKKYDLYLSSFNIENNKITVPILDKDGNKIINEKVEVTGYSTQNNGNNSYTSEIEEKDGTKVATLTINGWGEMSSGSTKKISYKATSLMSADADDLLYVNKVKIKKIQTDKLTTLQSNFYWKDDKTTITITPPTGENRSNVYVITVIVGMIFLIAGIIIIKKKVLD